MKIVAITQARTGSSRLPNKVLKTIGEESLLEIQINRIKISKKITDIIIATTVKVEDEVIEKEAQRLGVACFRGSEDDVLDRFYQAVKLSKPDYVVRLTSDCPLLDGHLIDEVVELALIENVDYCSNTLDETFPDGQDIEVFTFEALEKAWLNAKLISEREHVTPFIKNNSTFHKEELFKATNFYSEFAEYKDVRMTVDEPEDFVVISKMIEEFGKEESWNVYAKYYVENESVGSLNSCIVRNEGYIKSIKEDLQK
ncbi:glycosyltransferase family protein [Labilibaculum sp. DW002]|uniref:Glycosyltransferase family protein n=1 Tax=Paralabilibaculum antarcticum TaxID=2912572 RepID=A0ABT5VP68_9BACT|nr:glycosyltransferase family protein [Labilibaculum sp. DW002]MDE5417231.1 glycosyltransferase family protein [Labilibaculum sp. DW002]